MTYVVEFQANRNSWPFKQPVDPADVPNYYKVVKEPMGKQVIEIRDLAPIKLCNYIFKTIIF